MSATPYNPVVRAPIATEADLRRMSKVLAKHAPKVENVTPVAGDLPAEPHSSAANPVTGATKLKWAKLSEAYAVSECGQYRCRRYIPGVLRIGEVQAAKYQLEVRVENRCFYRLGPPLDSWPEARDAAQKHADNGV
jgi:hypothetical protein